jgi:23S rRNA (cytidine1920-2'-O)/16S rRNA (cytidine1409-2'-O)-methyltransferase
VARVDQLLVESGLAASRTAAQRLIAAGRVSWSGGIVKKPALDLAPETTLIVQSDPEDRFVSRGGLKLAGALAETGISVGNKRCLDVGQSTGGFSDCLLQGDASQVVGIDVGHGQLSRRLFGETRLSTIEGVNCRSLTAVDLGEHFPAGGFDLIVGDVSFISMTLILPQLPALLAAGGDILVLIKPQFEVGPANVGKNGIVRDPALYGEVENKLRQCASHLGLEVRAWLDSPITGGDGNREFFIWLN